MKSQMDGNTMWATDIEIFATSAMLGVDIFVSNDHSGYLKKISETKWYRYHSSPDGFTSTALYLTNYEEHFEPVIDLIHSRTITYFDSDSFSNVIIIE